MDDLKLDKTRKEKYSDFNSYIDYIEERIFYTFKNKTYLRQAFTHYSFAEYFKTLSNSVFIPIGKNKLKNVVVDTLINGRKMDFKEDNYEGFYLRGCQYLKHFDEIVDLSVSSPKLVEIFENLHIERFILYHEFKDASQNEDVIEAEANCFRALIGAIYVDSNNDENLIKELINKYYKLIKDEEPYYNYLVRYNTLNNNIPLKINSVILGNYFRVIVEIKINRRFHTFQGIGKSNTMGITMACEKAINYLVKTNLLVDNSLKSLLIYKTDTPITILESLHYNYGLITLPHYKLNEMRIYECKFIYARTGNLIKALGDSETSAALNAINKLEEDDRMYQNGFKFKKHKA